MIRIYLDFNVVVDIADGIKKIDPAPDQIFVYSDEHFVETARGGDARIADVLRELNAHKLELEHDDRFQMTGSWRLNAGDPGELYEVWREATAGPAYEALFLPILSRLLGADNASEVQQVPANIEAELQDLLATHGLLDDSQAKAIETLRSDLEKFVNDDLSQVPSLLHQRKALGMDGGRAGNLAESENPIEELWKVLAPTAPGVTADQFFGFAPHNFQPQTNTPIYLGIVGCYTALNSLGLRPDKRLSKPASLPGVQSDASHVGHAAFCHILLSADARLCAKARAIYRYKNIGTRVQQVTGA